MNQKLLTRWVIYLVGLVFLALGIMLNTKTGLGVSAVVSAPYAISALFGLNFGNCAAAFYVLMVIFQFVLLRKRFPLYGWLQIPMSLLFSRLLNLLAFLLPDATGWLSRAVMLALAIIFTGIGANLSLNMRLIANSADGAVQAISDVTGKELGFCKNCFDFGCLLFALCAGLIVNHSVFGVGVGLGTLASMLFIGRVIALINRLFREKMLTAAGLL